MAYVYRHIRLDKNEPFYIGIGADSNNGKYIRAYQGSRRRNKIWNDIYNKSDYKVEILFYDITWEEACDKEKELISIYGRIDNQTGTLANMTDGGDGGFGCPRSIETRIKMSNAHKGRIKSDETKKRMSIAQKGRVVSDETRKKLSESGRGIFSGGKHPSAKKVIDTSTGEVYECAKYAAKAIGIKYRTFHSYLTGQNPNKTNMRWL